MRLSPSVSRSNSVQQWAHNWTLGDSSQNRFFLFRPNGLPYIQEEKWGEAKENLKTESTNSLVKDY
jgi:hypothetical protein